MPLKKSILFSQLVSIFIFSFFFSVIYLLIASPIIAVFIIDDALSGKEFLLTLLSLYGMNFLFATLVLLPFSILLDFLYRKLRNAYFWLCAIGIMLITVTVYGVSVLMILSRTSDILVAIFNPFIIGVFSVVIICYWLFYRTLLFILSRFVK